MGSIWWRSPIWPPGDPVFQPLVEKLGDRCYQTLLVTVLKYTTLFSINSNQYNARYEVTEASDVCRNAPSIYRDAAAEAVVGYVVRPIAANWYPISALFNPHSCHRGRPAQETSRSLLSFATWIYWPWLGNNKARTYRKMLNLDPNFPRTAAVHGMP